MPEVDDAIKDMLRNAVKDPDGEAHEVELTAIVPLADYDALSNLLRLTGVINETLRLFPPAFETAREVRSGGVTVPTATFGLLDLTEGRPVHRNPDRASIPTRSQLDEYLSDLFPTLFHPGVLRGIHCDPHILGDDGMTWNPRRWDEIDLIHGLAAVPTHRIVNKRRQIGQYEYFPFLAGPRGCVGRQFALMELRF
ncbi:hypothetical protein GGF31_001911 [Allomyces arbusculus]|nr:hypothetical protein GGF31_001911 [Allomyces arbusculus]